MRLNHISFLTSDLDRLLNFYMDYFCDSINHKFVNDRGEIYGYILEFRDGGFIELLNSSADNLDKWRGNKSFHFCIEVRDLDSILKIIPATSLIVPPRVPRSHKVYQAMIVDPDLHQIELHQSSVLGS